MPALGADGIALPRDGGGVSQSAIRTARWSTRSFAMPASPPYLHDGRLLATHPLGRRLLALLDLAAGGTISRQAGDGVPDGDARLVNNSQDAYGGFRPSQWETYTRDAGVVAGLAQWQIAARSGSRAEARRSRRTTVRVAGGRSADRIDESLALRRRSSHAALAEHARRCDVGRASRLPREIASTYADGVSRSSMRSIGSEADSRRSRRACRSTRFCRAVRDDLESRDTIKRARRAGAVVRAERRGSARCDIAAAPAVSRGVHARRCRARVAIAAAPGPAPARARARVR